MFGCASIRVARNVQTHKKERCVDVSSLFHSSRNDFCVVCAVLLRQNFAFDLRFSWRFVNSITNRFHVGFIFVWRSATSIKFMALHMFDYVFFRLLLTIILRFNKVHAISMGSKMRVFRLLCQFQYATNSITKFHLIWTNFHFMNAKRSCWQIFGIILFCLTHSHRFGLFHRNSNSFTKSTRWIRYHAKRLQKFVKCVCHPLTRPTCLLTISHNLAANNIGGLQCSTVMQTRIVSVIKQMNQQTTLPSAAAAPISFIIK